MRRTSIMTTGFALIFIGIQLNLIESYQLTPRFTNFLSENGGGIVTVPANNVAQPSQFSLPSQVNQQFNTPYYQASASSPPYNANLQSGATRVITPPTWLCWPVLFLGAVVFLHGLGKRRD